MANTASAGGGGARPATTLTNRRPRGSALQINYGKRAVKAYPLTEDDLDTLGLLGAGATIAFSIFTGSAGYLISTTQNIGLSTADQSHIQFWSGTRPGVAVLALVALVAGLILMGVRGNRLTRIKSETEF